MGLDMYVTAKRYLWQHQPSDQETAQQVAQAIGALDGARVNQVECEIMYWRKANAIHKWFVDNVQGGVDDCSEYWVDPDKLQLLLETINQVLTDPEKAVELMPCQMGFFFGSTDIDEWYWSTLTETRDNLKKLLSQPLDGWDIYYHSSW
jgi:hypothetical protein